MTERGKLEINVSYFGLFHFKMLFFLTVIHTLHSMNSHRQISHLRHKKVILERVNDDPYICV